MSWLLSTVRGPATSAHHNFRGDPMNERLQIEQVTVDDEQGILTIKYRRQQEKNVAELVARYNALAGRLAELRQKYDELHGVWDLQRGSIASLFHQLDDAKQKIANLTDLAVAVQRFRAAHVDALNSTNPDRKLREARDPAALAAIRTATRDTYEDMQQYLDPR